MPLEIPQIGDSNYQAILNEAISRIRVHNPEWNNHNDSDPGITLLQLFSFMTENILYRANLIPERNRVKFLKLLGIPMQPASAATGIIVFANEKGPSETITLDADLEVLAGKVSFRTKDAVDVLPVEPQVYYKRKVESVSEELKTLYQLTYGDRQSSTEPVFYETTRLAPPVDANLIAIFDIGANMVVDHSLWLALLARPNDGVENVRSQIANKILNLGIYPAEEDQAVRTLTPGGEATAENQQHLVYEHSTDERQADGTPKYERLTVLEQGNPLVEPDVVKLRLPGANKLKTWTFAEEQDRGTGDFPPALPQSQDNDRVIAWIRIRLPSADRRGGLNAKLSWIGINAASVAQQAHVAVENLGQGNGEPDQTVLLVNTPVIRDSVQLKINGVTWKEIEDLRTAGPEVPVRSPGKRPGLQQANIEQNYTDRSVRQKNSMVFTLDHESGQIRFGDGEYGMRPPMGAQMLASYDYGGGRSGNVNIGAINKGPTVPAGLSVHNPLPTWGGDEAETPEEAEKGIMKFLQHRDRLVTETDFKDIVRRTPGVDIGRAEVLTLFNPDLPDNLSPGVVTVLVIPRYDTVHPDAPQPDTRMLDLICRHLGPRRLVSTEVHVHGPVYKPVVVSVGIQVVAGQDFPPVREAVNKALKRFLSPLHGGRQENGWPLEKVVMVQELWAEAARVDGVAFVKKLLLGNEDGLSLDETKMEGLQLPQLVKVDTRLGDPEDLESLIRGGTPDEPSIPTEPIVPIPVLPPEC
jgi:hypothetical protein